MQAAEPHSSEAGAQGALHVSWDAVEKPRRSRGEATMQSCERRTAGLPRWAALLLVQCLGFARPEAGAARDPRAEIASMYHTVWSVKDGAPAGVQVLAQSSDGLLWLGAHNGLYSFDGVRFSSVRRVGSIELPVGEVYALLAPRSGGLWISYLFGGITFIRDGKASNYSSSDGVPRNTITDFAEGSDGEIWASSPAGLFRWSQRRWEDVTERYGLRTRFLRSVPGMRERAASFEGELNVWSQTGAGTEVELKIPAGMAYVRPTRL